MNRALDPLAALLLRAHVRPMADADGYASCMPWWKGEDRRYPTKRE